MYCQRLCVQRFSNVYKYTRAIAQENQQFAYAKTKAHISYAVTTQLNNAFVFATRIVKFLFLLKVTCTDRFVSDLVGNQNGWFSHAKAHNIVTRYGKMEIIDNIKEDIGVHRKTQRAK